MRKTNTPIVSAIDDAIVSANGIACAGHVSVSLSLSLLLSVLPVPFPFAKLFALSFGPSLLGMRHFAGHELLCGNPRCPFLAARGGTAYCCEKCQGRAEGTLRSAGHYSHCERRKPAVAGVERAFAMGAADTAAGTETTEVWAGKNRQPPPTKVFYRVPACLAQDWWGVSDIGFFLFFFGLGGGSVVRRAQVVIADSCLVCENVSLESQLTTPARYVRVIGGGGIAEFLREAQVCFSGGQRVETMLIMCWGNDFCGSGKHMPPLTTEAWAVGRPYVFAGWEALARLMRRFVSKACVALPAAHCFPKAKWDDEQRGRFDAMRGEVARALGDLGFQVWAQSDNIRALPVGSDGFHYTMAAARPLAEFIARRLAGASPMRRPAEPQAPPAAVVPSGGGVDCVFF